MCVWLVRGMFVLGRIRRKFRIIYRSTRNDAKAWNELYIKRGRLILDN